MKIEFTTTAYTSDEYSLAELMDGLSKNDSLGAGDALSFSKLDMSSRWVKVGTAQITVELLDAKQIQNKQLAVLQAQLQKERADSQVRQNAILEQISKLQALEWEGVQA